MKMKKLFAVLFLTMTVAALSFAQQKYALVIGNGNYTGISKLNNPVNDAKDITSSLKNLGFNVDLKLNLTINELDNVIEQFLSKLRSNKESEGFFWFAGHGLNIDNKQYLLAVNVDPQSNNSIIRGSYSVDTLVKHFDNVGNKANLIVIDACRNVSLPGQRNLGGRGLAVVPSESVVGNQIVYSTMAGQVASDGKPGDRNSPFASAFLTHIRTSISFDNLFIRIAEETRKLTNGIQRPYKLGYFTIENYSLAASQPAVAIQQNSTATERRGGLSVVSRNVPDTFVFYSPNAGGDAADGPAGGNSPFTQAFLNNFNKTEPLNLLAIDIVADTYELTSRTQKPSYDSQILNNRMYSLVNNSNKRYALVIGNGEYTNIANLSNTINDARSVARALSALGYNVDLRIDVTKHEMENAVSAFLSRLSSDNDSEGFFWYAGHGIQADSVNYLLPVDSNFTDKIQLRRDAFSLYKFFNNLKDTGNKINVIFLDVSRSNSLFLPSSR